MKKAVKMIAHRGRSGAETENTIAAFVAAGNRSFYGIETDVHRTADGQYVIIHDDSTGRVAPVDLPVEGSRFEELRSISLFDMDGKSSRCDLRIPTLAEYIHVCQRYDKVSVLELKNAFSQEDVDAVLSAVKEKNRLSQTIFISFYLDNLKMIRSRLPEQPLQYLTCGFDEAVCADLKWYRLGLDMLHTKVTPEVVTAIHELGQEINCWTVNEPSDADRLRAMGVDYITTNILE